MTTKQKQSIITAALMIFLLFLKPYSLQDSISPNADPFLHPAKCLRCTSFQTSLHRHSESSRQLRNFCVLELRGGFYGDNEGENLGWDEARLQTEKAAQELIEDHHHQQQKLPAEPLPKDEEDAFRIQVRRNNRNLILCFTHFMRIMT
jgi:hypothetical protein